MRCQRSYLPAAFSLSLLVLAASCQVLSRRQPQSVPAAATADSAALFDQVKMLEGEWLMKDETGVEVTGSVFKVTSGGSAVREILFPGTSHEMTNVYHMDGPDLLVTHYCAASNQPTMRARRGEPGVLQFKLDRLTDWQGGQEHYMGELTLRIADRDHIVMDWTTFNAGPGHPGTVKFEMRRK